VDTKGTADPHDDNLVPSCSGDDDSKAYPPRRIVEVARGFGKNGVIQSICQKNFGPAMDAIIATIAEELGPVCLPRPLVRNRDGLVECNVIWELPPHAMGDTPTRCDERAFLLPPDPGRATRSAKGGAVCKVAQLAVVDLEAPSDPNETKMAVSTSHDGQVFEQGWYYDEFSKATQAACKKEVDKQRITFTALAQPPTGVKVKLECLNEAQRYVDAKAELAPDVEQPSIGDPCQSVRLRGQEVSDDDACVVLLSEPGGGVREDRTMFCHDNLRVCVKSCTSDADCPSAWVCDTRQASVATAGGQAYCTNPTCGSSQD